MNSLKITIVSCLYFSRQVMRENWLFCMNDSRNHHITNVPTLKYVSWELVYLCKKTLRQILKAEFQQFQAKEGPQMLKKSRFENIGRDQKPCFSSLLSLLWTITFNFLLSKFIDTLIFSLWNVVLELNSAYDNISNYSTQCYEKYDFGSFQKGGHRESRTLHSLKL